MNKKDTVSQVDIDKAASLFKRYHKKSPRKGQIISVALKPTAALEIGQMHGISYIAGGKKYFHKFNERNRPLVFVSADGKQIVILKGGYQFIVQPSYDGQTEKVGFQG